MTITKSLLDDLGEELRNLGETMERLIGEQFEGMGPGMRSINDRDFLAFVISKSDPRYQTQGLDPVTGKLGMIPGNPNWLLAVRLMAENGDEASRDVMQRLSRIKRDGLAPVKEAEETYGIPS